MDSCFRNRAITVFYTNRVSTVFIIFNSCYWGFTIFNDCFSSCSISIHNSDFMRSIMFVSNAYGWRFTIIDCCFSRYTFWICNNNSMASISIITNRCSWSTSIYSISTVLHNKCSLGSIWICNGYSMISIIGFSNCCCCCFTILPIFDDSISNITVSICHFNCMSAIVIIRYFNFWSFSIFTVSNNRFFRCSIWVCYSNRICSIWIFRCDNR